ncbi:hypothetical protein BU24DRAFT_146544 [Aaosphaeria arxii CBS 175.79]|uniref:Uncharacterized protein n=1 Tax=Aaosphaeria arxii CBS 175.79 TaxID=1450172 RepID=A0A6A5XWB4_9PLEO|nr:uncharacterized protein BU24DRAFT_146544 [Aaosphaeria arxii CBS 175.79]KAF2017236.1 hypothetical protein BU24DRAFT_146544 [Aaosphaeria arxii CBS 175.79]
MQWTAACRRFGRRGVGACGSAAASCSLMVELLVFDGGSDQRSHFRVPAPRNTFLGAGGHVYCMMRCGLNSGFVVDRYACNLEFCSEWPLTVEAEGTHSSLTKVVTGLIRHWRNTDASIKARIVSIQG